MSSTEHSGQPFTGAPIGAEVGTGTSPWLWGTVLLRWRRFVAVVVIACVLFVAVLSLFRARTYTAVASFVPQEPASTQIGLRQLASQFGLVPPSASTSSPNFYAELLQSREVLAAVVATEYGPLDSMGSRGNLIQYFQTSSRNRDAAVAGAVRRLRRMINVSANRLTGVVHIEVRSPDRLLSVQVTQQLLEQVNDYNLRRRQSQARAEREFVERRLATAKATLRAAEEAVSGFYGRNRSFAESPVLEAEEARLQREVSLRQQLYVTLSQNYEAAKIDEVRNTPVITLVERPEGYVDERGRGVVRNSIVAFLVGGMLAIGIAFAGEYLGASRRAQSADYRLFVSLFREAVANARSSIFTRAGGRYSGRSSGK